MLNLPLWIALVILAALLACGETTPTPRGATAPATAEGSTSLPSPVTPAAEPTETPQATPTETTVPSAATWTLRILSGISEGICNTMVQSGGEFLYIGVGGR